MDIRLFLVALGALAGPTFQEPNVRSQAVAALRNLKIDAQTRHDVFNAGLAALAARPDASFVGSDAAPEAELAQIGRDRQSESIWYSYNTKYWTNISVGQYLSQAISNAMRDCSGPGAGSYSPKQQGLIQRYGDAQIPAY